MNPTNEQVYVISSLVLVFLASALIISAEGWHGVKVVGALVPLALLWGWYSSYYRRPPQ